MMAPTWPTSRAHDRPQHNELNPTSGMFPAALQAGIDRASCNQNENERPRLRLTRARTGGTVLDLVVAGDGSLASVTKATSQASPELHHIVVDPSHYCAYCILAAEVLVAQRRCVNNAKAPSIARDIGQRRGKAFSGDKPMANGGPPNLEVVGSKLVCPPRALAIISAHVQGLFPQDASASLEGTLWAATRSSSSSLSCSFSLPCCSSLLCRCSLDLLAPAPFSTSPDVLLLLLPGVGVCVRWLSCLRACGVSLCVRGVTSGWHACTSLASDADLGGKVPDGVLPWSHIRASLMHEVGPFTGCYTGRCAMVRCDLPPSMCLVCLSCGPASPLSLLGFW